MKSGTNAPGIPRYAGEYCVFQSPHHRDVLLVDRAEVRDSSGSLRWAAVNDDNLANAVRAAYDMEWFNGIPHPGIRTGTLRQYAANLAGRAIERGEQGDLSIEELASAIANYVLNATSGKNPIQWAIEQGLEVPAPYLAEIEKMMAITARSTHDRMTRIAILDELSTLRLGASNLGLRDIDCPNQLIHDRLIEVQKKLPPLLTVPIPAPETELEQRYETAPGTP